MQESKLIKLTDSVQLIPVESAEKLQKDFMQMPMVSGKRPLYVRLAATHAGLITRNNAYYLPDKMRAGTATFLQNYPKPVLVAHNEEADPVGRVARAKYIDVPVDQLKPFLNYSEAKDAYLIGKVPVEPRFWDAFNNGKLSYLRSVDFVVDSLFKSGVLDNPEFPGLGYIELVLNITDSEAQEKFLDGRYLTASTSMTTNKAICTICKQDWASDGICDHKRGKKYDGVKCVLVTGDITYDEVSVVSRPADRHSKVLQIGQELIDNVEDSTDMEDNTREVFKGLPWSILDSLEEENNTVADEAINTTNPEPDKLVNEEEVFQKRAEADKAAVLDFFTKYANNEYPDDANVNKALTDLVSSVEFSVVPEFVSVVQDQLKSKELDSADKLWDSLVNEEWSSYDESEDEALGAEDLKDAKLSGEQRKKLASSTFCGPNRSFPVPDCCLSFSTKIKLLDGTSRMIGELVDSKNDIWVYGYDHDKRAIVPAKVSKVWLAIKDAPIYRIVLDNGQFVDCTGNHPFLTKDGVYVRADKLQPGQSLMPLYTILSKNRDGLGAYEKVYQPWYNFWEYTHHMVARESQDRTIKRNENIHHINSKKKDNRPENLEFVNRTEHLNYHFVPGSRDNRTWQAFERLCEIALSGLKPTTIKLICSKRIFNFSNPDLEIPGTGATLRGISRLLEQGIPRKKIAKVIKIDDRTLLDWLNASGVNTSISDTRTGNTYKEALLQQFKIDFGSDLNQVHQDVLNTKDFSIVQDKYGIDRDAARTWFNRIGLKTDNIKSSRTTFHNTSLNHTVASIEIIGNEDAYDMEVPATSNFALDAGVFVHNSHVTAARRLIGRAKVSAATKSRILGCVARKARALGCDTVQDNVAQEMERLEVVCEACKDAASKLAVLEAFINDLTAKLKDTETKPCEKCVVLESKVSDSVKDLEAARAELQIVLKDVQELQNQLVDSVEVSRKLKAERLADLALLKGRELNDKQPINKEFRDSLVNQFLTGDLDLDVQLKDATEAVDIIKIADSINSGLARNPSRTLEDPVPRQSNQGNSRKESKMPDADSLRNITETYLAGKLGGNIPGFGRGTVAAERYLDSLKQRGLLPAEFNVGSEAT